MSTVVDVTAAADGWTGAVAAADVVCVCEPAVGEPAAELVAESGTVDVDVFGLVGEVGALARAV